MISIAGIVFSCVAANHLGLVGAVERLVGRSLPIINCPKCLTFWAVCLYSAFRTTLTDAVAIAFICAYSATWLELGMYYVDTIYMLYYGKITDKRTAYNQTAATAGGDDTESAVPRLRENKRKT